GYKVLPKKVTILSTGEEIKCELVNQSLRFHNLPKEAPDKICGVTVLKMEFDDVPQYARASHYPQINYGSNLE
ncbi:MAG: hypothetical protein MJ236_01350, partial [Clostridia bacterium]|nr:hypothetical protein [Clostridia bacterium]